jgi:hypothetical protein
MLRPGMQHKSLSVFGLSAGLSALLLASASGACSPSLGDGCSQSTDCSVNGDRTCDRAQPGGYCTIPDCSPGSCGDEGYCVRFKPDQPRLARDWCMAKCSDTGDCNRDRYVCRSAEQMNCEYLYGNTSCQHELPDGGISHDGANPDRTAEVLDKNTSGKFCVVKRAD